MINNSAVVDCQILLNFGRYVGAISVRGSDGIVKIHFRSNLRWRPNGVSITPIGILT